MVGGSGVMLQLYWRMTGSIDNGRERTIIIMAARAIEVLRMGYFPDISVWQQPRSRAAMYSGDWGKSLFTATQAAN